MKVLIVKNFTTERPWGQRTVDSITSNIRRSQPSAEVVAIAPIDGDAIPDLSQFQLVVLTGGTFNLLDGHRLPWVDSVLDLIRRVAGGALPDTKLLGFCWGHQAITFALGGRLGTLEKPRICIGEVQPSGKGPKLFDGDSALKLHKFHKRYCSQPPAGFEVLAVDNEILMSESGRILSFQSHPELTAEISQDLIDSDSGSYIQGGAGFDVHGAHDGERVWDVMIMKWAMG